MFVQWQKFSTLLFIPSSVYSFRHKKVILDLNNNEDPARSSDETERQVSAIVEFCEEKTVCRRILLLRHFGEHFDKKDCGDACDNCANAGLLVSRDLSTQASLAVRTGAHFGGETGPTHGAAVHRGAQGPKHGAHPYKREKSQSPIWSWPQINPASLR